jgi:hypothetical protein
VDMGKKYDHSVKNKFLCAESLDFTMVMMVTFCSLVFVRLWFSG